MNRLLRRMSVCAGLLLLIRPVSAGPAASPAATNEPSGGGRVISFAEGKWDRGEWTVLRQPNQKEPRSFAQNRDSIGMAMAGYKPDDYGNETDNAILAIDTGMTEGQVEITLKAGEGFNKSSTPGIVICPQIVNGVMEKGIDVFIAPYGFAGWMYTPGDAARPLRYTFVGQLGRTLAPDQTHVLRCRYSKKRKALALQVDESDIFVVKFVGHPTLGVFPLEMNSTFGIWGCHGVCQFYQMKILPEGTLPFDWPGN
jgi:hypothetical protein